MFVKNIELNKDKSITPYQMAISDQQDGVLTLRRDPGAGDAMRYLLPKDAGNHSSNGNTLTDAGDVEEVPITNLDYFVAQNQIDRVDFLKMDVEGNEFSVFRGAEKMLRANPKIMLMFECSRDASEIFQFLRNLDFKLYCRIGSKTTWDIDDDTLAQAGNIWACRDQAQLPKL
jgi:FkbM family methyltransferase